MTSPAKPVAPGTSDGPGSSEIPDARGGPRTSDGPDLAAIDVLTVLQALSDPVRLEIVRQLAGCGAGGELRCGQIELPVSKSTTTHHLRTLSTAGITAEREEGTRKFIRLRRPELDDRFPGLIDSVLGAGPRRGAPPRAGGRAG